MIANIYSIKDVKIGFMAPFLMQNDAVAVRAFSNSARAAEPNSVNTDYEDKELWLLGRFDDQTGIVESEVKYICKAADFKEA